MKNKKLAWLVLVLQLVTFKISAQQVESGSEMLEVLRAAAVYRSVPNLSFDLQYTFADSTRPSIVLEQLNGSAKVSSGRYWCMLDSIEFLQGYQYHLAVYRQDSTIVLSNPSNYSGMVQLPPMDSLFIVNNVTSMNVVTDDDSTRLLTVQFRPDAAYSQCKVYYDRYKYLIRKVQYNLKGVPIDSATGMTSGVALITLTINNYTEQVIDPQLFQEDKFIYKLNGQFYMKPEYANYKLLVNNSN